jgi:hypothetical protein
MARFTLDPSALWNPTFSVSPNQKGYEAGQAGCPLADNPHDLGTSEHRQWTRGHIDGASDRHRELGTYATRAGLHDYEPVHDPVAEILEMDEDLALRGPPTPPDPTAILDEPPLRFDGEPQRVAVLGHGHLPSFLNPRGVGIFLHVDIELFCRAAAASAVSMQEAIDSMNQLMASAVSEVEALRVALAEDTDDRSGSLARKRHGRNAVCPKHGPTRGGTCLTCARGHR